MTDELDAAILEMAQDARETGGLGDVAFEEITMRQSGRAAAAIPMTGQDIRALRERAPMSQAVFARWLNLTPGYVSEL